MIRLLGKWLVPYVMLRLIVLTSIAFPLRGADWKPISPQEMALKDDPMNPGATAIVLFHEEFTDDIYNLDRNYTRIKILKEEGKKFADIQLPFRRGQYNIRDIEARTVQPDGTSIEFKGEIYEKQYEKNRSSNIAAKTFTLPGVSVGSIIEYKFKTFRDLQRYYFNRRWDIQQAFSIRECHFTLMPNRRMMIAWVSMGLPAGNAVKLMDDGSVQLHLQNVKALPEEENMPPIESLRARVMFYYLPEDLDISDIKGPDDFWRPTGKKYFKTDNDFIGKRREIQALADELVKGETAPEAKLRKLYARAQQIRNLSYERDRTENEERKEKVKSNTDVGDVYRNGYGDGGDINYFFAALARAAGFDAAIIHVTTRDENVFEPQVFSTRQFNASLVHVKLGDQQWFLDPASRYAPFNYMPWQETASRGIRPDKDGYSLITTPLPKGENAVTERKADLKLDPEGNLEGTARVVYLGQEALEWRREHHDQDEAGYRKAMEDDLKDWLPDGATVELTNKPAWASPEEQLTAEFKTKIPNFATPTGRRLLLPLGVFQAKEKYPFRAIRRVHPVHLDYPRQELDEVKVELPAGIEVESLPATRKKDFPSLHLEMSRTQEGRAVRLQRKVAVDSYSFPTTAYSSLRVLYDNVRAGDEEQIVLKTVESAQAQ